MPNNGIAATMASHRGTSVVISEFYYIRSPSFKHVKKDMVCDDYVYRNTLTEFVCCRVGHIRVNTTLRQNYFWHRNIPDWNCSFAAGKE